MGKETKRRSLRKKREEIYSFSLAQRKRNKRGDTLGALFHNTPPPLLKTRCARISGKAERPKEDSQPTNLPCPKEGFEPLTKPLANRSCVPLVASEQARAGKRLKQRVAEADNYDFVELAGAQQTSSELGLYSLNRDFLWFW